MCQFLYSLEIFSPIDLADLMSEQKGKRIWIFSTLVFHRHLESAYVREISLILSKAWISLILHSGRHRDIFGIDI